MVLEIGLSTAVSIALRATVATQWKGAKGAMGFKRNDRTEYDGA
jgi:hypothetical protein